MENKPKPPRRQSKEDLKKALLARLDAWINEGNTPMQAVERLSQKQFDFLADCEDVDLDNYTMTQAQRDAVKEIQRAPRPTFPNGYTKRYPQDKKDLYNQIMEFLVSRGASVDEREKQNFRDMDFTINGKKYKIVLSEPRAKKE